MRRIAITVKRQMTCKELVSILASNNVKADRVSLDEYGVLIVPWDKVLLDGETVYYRPRNNIEHERLESAAASTDDIELGVQPPGTGTPQDVYLEEVKQATEFIYYESGHIKIGTVWCSIPPLSINIGEVSINERLQTMRTQGSIHLKTGRGNITIDIELIFPSVESINNELRQIIACFKRTPFLEVKQRHLSAFLNIDTGGYMRTVADDVKQIPSIWQKLIDVALKNCMPDAGRHDPNIPKALLAPALRTYKRVLTATEYKEVTNRDIENLLDESNRIGDREVAELAERLLHLRKLEQVKFSIASEVTAPNLSMDKVMVTLSNVTVSTMQGNDAALQVHLSLLLFNYRPYLPRIEYITPEGDRTNYLEDSIFMPWMNKMLDRLRPVNSFVGTLALTPPVVKEYEPADIYSLRGRQQFDYRDMIEHDDSQRLTLEPTAGRSVVASINAHLSNIVTSLPIQGSKLPVHQYLGSQDTYFTVVIETTDEVWVQKLQFLHKKLEQDVRNKRKYFKFASFKIEQEIVNLLGVEYINIDEIAIADMEGSTNGWVVTLRLVEDNIHSKQYGRIQHTDYFGPQTIIGAMPMLWRRPDVRQEYKKVLTEIMGSDAEKVYTKEEEITTRPFQDESMLLLHRHFGRGHAREFYRFHGMVTPNDTSVNAKILSQLRTLFKRPDIQLFPASARPDISKALLFDLSPFGWDRVYNTKSIYETPWRDVGDKFFIQYNGKVMHIHDLIRATTLQDMKDQLNSTHFTLTYEHHLVYLPHFVRWLQERLIDDIDAIESIKETEYISPTYPDLELPRYDDGLMVLLDKVYPHLRELGYSAAHYVPPTFYVYKTNMFETYRPMLDKHRAALAGKVNRLRKSLQAFMSPEGRERITPRYITQRVTGAKMIDGDTVRVTMEDGKEVYVRLAGVDTPERTHDKAANRDSKYLAMDAETYNATEGKKAQEALNFAEKYVTKIQSVTYDENSAYGTYGRLVGYVNVQMDTGTKTLNVLIAEAGHSEYKPSGVNFEEPIQYRNNPAFEDNKDTLDSVYNPKDINTVEHYTELFDLHTGKYSTMYQQKDWDLDLAFPTFWISFIQEDNEKIRRFDDFYSYSAITMIDVVSSRKSGIDTAVISLVNPFNKVGGPAGKYELQGVYADTTLEQDVYRIPLETGELVQIKMGYDSNSDMLNTVFTGQIASYDVGEVITITCQSFGAELYAPIGYEPHKPGEGWGPLYFVYKHTLKQVMPILEGIPRAFTGRLHFNYEQHAIQHLLQDPRVIHFGVPTLIDLWFWSSRNENIYSPQRDNWWLLEVQRAMMINNSTIWDTMQSLTKRFPHMVCATRPYGHRATLFFGRPDELYFYVDKRNMKYRRWYAQQKRINELHRQQAGLFVAESQKMWQQQNWEDYDEWYDKYVMFNEQENPRQKPFRNYHYITSHTRLVSNQVQLSERGVYNEVTLIYSEDNGGKRASYTLKADDDIPDELTHTLVVEDPTAVGTIGKRVAHNVAASYLRDALRDMYTGNLVLVGDSSIWPYDRCILMDFYNDMFGPCDVEQVVHIMSKQTGYTTMITPDLTVYVGDWHGIHKPLCSMGAWAAAGTAALVGLAVLPGGLLAAAGLTILGGVLGIFGRIDEGKREPVFLLPMIHKNKPYVSGVKGFRKDKFWSNIHGQLRDFNDGRLIIGRKIGEFGTNLKDAILHIGDPDQVFKW